MSHATQLARIAALGATITDVGRIHSWPRLGDLYEHYVVTIGGIEQIRAWEIGLDEPGIEGERQTEAHASHYYHWRIQGYVGLEDATAAYNTILALGEAWRAKLEADPTLGGTCLDMVGENQGSPDISAPDTVSPAGGHLCWGISITFTTYDLTSI